MIVLGFLLLIENLYGSFSFSSRNAGALSSYTERRVATTRYGLFKIEDIVQKKNFHVDYDLMTDRGGTPPGIPLTVEEEQAVIDDLRKSSGIQKSRLANTDETALPPMLWPKDHWLRIVVKSRNLPQIRQILNTLLIAARQLPGLVCTGPHFHKTEVYKEDIPRAPFGDKYAIRQVREPIYKQSLRLFLTDQPGNATTAPDEINANNHATDLATVIRKIKRVNIEAANLEMYTHFEPYLRLPPTARLTRNLGDSWTSQWLRHFQELPLKRQLISDILSDSWKPYVASHRHHLVKTHALMSLSLEELQDILDECKFNLAQLTAHCSWKLNDADADDALLRMVPFNYSAVYDNSTVTSQGITKSEGLKREMALEKDRWELLNTMRAKWGWPPLPRLDLDPRTVNLPVIAASDFAQAMAVKADQASRWKDRHAAAMAALRAGIRPKKPKKGRV